MAKIIKCVPNVSEGRDADVIKSISDVIKSTPGCTLCDCNIGYSINRTVYTFVGDVRSVVQGAFAVAKAVYDRIDMSLHQGQHPRIGALDVCPFVPIQNATMDDCVRCANEFGKLLADELQVPVYLYGFAATTEKKKLLPNIRRGEYENLRHKLLDPEWKPDYGPSNFVSKWGATVTGARKFSIAYNVNILGTKEQAHHIASYVRESGTGPQNPGKLKNVQGIGWYLHEYGLAQVSCNMTDFIVTPIHALFEEVKGCAQEMKVPVTGSEIVGLVPLESILQAANFYIEKEKLLILDERSKVTLAINRLGLNSVAPFDPDKRIIEYCFADEKRDCPLASKTLKSYIKSTGSRTHAPGAVSVSASIAAMGAGLATMAGRLTYEKHSRDALDDVFRQNISLLYVAMEDLVQMIDRTPKAFDSYTTALKLPNTTKEEEKSRDLAMQEGIITAMQVSLSMMEMMNKCWPHLIELARSCDTSCAADIEVGAKCLETGSFGALQSVLTHLLDLTDEVTRKDLEKSARDAYDLTKSNCEYTILALHLRTISD